jgi:hypothetical protein
MPEAESRGAATGVELAGFCFALSDCAIATTDMPANTEIKIFLFICSPFRNPFCVSACQFDTGTAEASLAV